MTLCVLWFSSSPGGRRAISITTLRVASMLTPTWFKWCTLRLIFWVLAFTESCSAWKVLGSIRGSGLFQEGETTVLDSRFFFSSAGVFILIFAGQKESKGPWLPLKDMPASSQAGHRGDHEAFFGQTECLWSPLQ